MNSYKAVLGWYGSSAQFCSSGPLARMHGQAVEEAAALLTTTDLRCHELWSKAGRALHVDLGSLSK